MHTDKEEEHDELWAAQKLQALERGRQARKKNEIGSLALQAKLMKKAVSKLKKLKPLEGKLLQGGFPGAPVNASIQLALQLAPDGSSPYETSRDAVLRFFVVHTKLFTNIAIFFVVVFLIDILIIIVFFWGAVLGVGIMDPNDECVVNMTAVYNASAPGYGKLVYTYEGSTHYPHKRCDVWSGPPPDGSCSAAYFVAEFCNLNQYVFNINIKVIVIVLTYVNFLPIPWRIAILVDAIGDVIHPDPAVGLDFYGRPTEALWFHISRLDRARISFFLNTAWFFHMINLVFILYYWNYIDTQIWPGAFLINMPALLSIGSVITGGVLQGKAEQKLIDAQPERFPPAPTKYIKEGFHEWRTGKSGKPLMETIKAKLSDFEDTYGDKGGPSAGMGLMEIKVAVPSSKSDV